jgi:hypothetical protein
MNWLYLILYLITMPFLHPEQFAALSMVTWIPIYLIVSHIRSERGKDYYDLRTASQVEADEKFRKETLWGFDKEEDSDE